MRTVKATLYKTSEFFGNVHRIEVRAFEVEIAKYAQYPSAVRIRYVEKGARRARECWLTYNPYCVILEGHGHPEPADVFPPVAAVSDDGVITSRSRHLSHDPAWRTEFDAVLGVYLAKSGAKVAHDFRGFNTYAPRPAPPADEKKEG